MNQEETKNGKSVFDYDLSLVREGNLKSKNVEFEEHNIELSEEDREECYKISGDLIVPVTTVNGKDFVVSFDKAKLDALLGL